MISVLILKIITGVLLTLLLIVVTIFFAETVADEVEAQKYGRSYLKSNNKFIEFVARLFQ